MNVYKGGILNVLGFVVPGFIFIPLYGFFSRTLSSELFGLFVSFNIFVAYLVFLDAGISRVVIYFIAKRNSKGESWFDVFTVSLLFCFAICSVSVIFINYLISTFLVEFNAYPNLGSYLHFTVTLIIPSTIFSILFMSLYEAHGQFFILNVIRIFQGTLYSLLPFVVFLLKIDLLFIFPSMSLSRFIILVLCLTILRGSLLKGYKFEVGIRSTALNMFRYGRWVLLTNLLSPAMTFADRFMISTSSTIGHLYVSFYGTLTELISKLSLLPLAFCRSLFPKLAVQNNNVKMFTVSYSIFVLFLTAGFAIVMGFLIDKIMLYWVNIELDVMMRYTSWLILGSFVVNSTSQVYFSALQARGLAKSSAIFIALQVTPTIVIMYYLFTEFGMLGVALTLLLRNVIDLLVNMTYFIYVLDREGT